MKAAIGGFSYSFFDSRQSVEKVRPPQKGQVKVLFRRQVTNCALQALIKQGMKPLD